MSAVNSKTPTTIISGLALTESQKARVALAGGELLLDDAVNRVAESRELVGKAEVWFGGGLNADLLAIAPRLKWLQTATVGAEYNLFPELAASDVVMTNVRGRHSGTCDHAIALLLALARSLPKLVLQQQRSEWTRLTEPEVIPLGGSTALILGTGQIGQGVARRLRAFGVHPQGLSLSGAQKPDFDKVYGVEKLLEAVKDADWIINALPFTPESRGILSGAFFDAAKDGAVFVNIGRGKTVDQTALTSALTSGKLRCAGLDVFVQEPLEQDSPLWRMPNVIITPHAAGVTADGDPRELGLDALLGNLARFRAGEELNTPIDKAKGY